MRFDSIEPRTEKARTARLGSRSLSCLRPPHERMDSVLTRWHASAQNFTSSVAYRLYAFCSGVKVIIWPLTSVIFTGAPTQLLLPVYWKS